MAERRMFAKTIIDSDSFLDMPLSAQSLYFHLSMRADDEGFINNPKKIQRMIGASDDDIKILIAKRFIIPFESGIVVIKHWRIHNYIRADRLVETKYQDERSLLTVKENGAYTLSEEIKEIESLDANDKRKIAYKNSSLPYSFTYKIKRAFEGCVCPVCGKTMTSSVKICLPTVQHNLPISKGGKHELDNISIICESCNTSIRDEETGELNNAEVIETWDRIVYADQHKIKWFDHPEVLKDINDSQLSGICQPDVSTGKDSIGKDSIGKNSKDNTSIAPSSNESEAVAKLPLNENGTFHYVLPSDVEHYRELYPGVDVEQELRNMTGWLEANRERRKTKRGVQKFINNWLSKAQNRAKGSPQKKGDLFYFDVD